MMAVDLYELKLDTQRIEELIPILEKIDVVIELLKHYNTDEALLALELLKEYKKEIEELILNKDNILILANDLKKGSYNGKRKLDIDLALNKKGIASSKSIEEALSIWIDENTRVYYNALSISFSDNTIVNINFVNDDNEPISISTNEELAYQINKSAVLTEKLVNTRCVVDSGGKVGNLVRITDLDSKVSNIKSLTLVVEQKCKEGLQVELKPSYTWLDTTSILILLMDVLSLIDRLPEDLNEFNDNLIEIINNLQAIQIISHYIKGFCPRSFDMGYITSPLGDEKCGGKDIFKIVAENIDDIVAVANMQIDELIVTDKEIVTNAIDTLGLTDIFDGVTNTEDGTAVNYSDSKEGKTVGERVANAIQKEYAMELKLRRGTTAENSLFTGAISELVHITDTNELAIHDGVNAGGHLIANKEYVRGVVSELQNRVDELSSKIGNIGSESLKIQLDKIKEEIKALEGSTTTNIQDISTNLSNIKKEIEDLKLQISNLKILVENYNAFCAPDYRNIKSVTNGETFNENGYVIVDEIFGSTIIYIDGVRVTNHSGADFDGNRGNIRGKMYIVGKNSSISWSGNVSCRFAPAVYLS